MKKLGGLFIVAVFLISMISIGTKHNLESSTFQSNADFNKDDYKKIIASNNQLGFDLVANTEENKEGNLFISPTSLMMALSMVYNGADGLTKEELANVLHAKGIEVKQLNQANASLQSMLQQDSKQNQLHIANSIWMNHHFHFQADFEKNNRSYFNAKIQEIDPNNSQTAQIINNWVKKSTGGKINKIIKPSDVDPNTVAFLLNAIYFKGDWKNRFNKRLTKKQTFHLENGTSKKLPLMILKEKLAYMENQNFQAVELPYAEEKMSMKVFLPNDDSSLEQFKKTLTLENWDKWNAEFQEQEGTILIPKFQVEYEANLSEPLKKLGMVAAFDDNKAQFTKMVKENQPIWIDKIKQKTFISVNEEGSEAAAATSEKMKAKSAPMTGKPFNMEVNRPFFVVISDNETGAILFMGSVSNPQKSTKN